MTLDAEQTQNLLEEHLERYPQMEATDAYLLVRQAVLGPATEIPPLRDVIRMQLHGQIAQLDEERQTLPHEEPVELLHPETSMGRVHLRPYLRAGGSPERLVKALEETRGRFQAPGVEALGGALGALRSEIARVAPSSIPLPVFDALLREMIGQQMPALEHSASYQEAYQPLYHLVLLDALA